MANTTTESQDDNRNQPAILCVACDTPCIEIKQKIICPNPMCAAIFPCCEGGKC